MSKVYFVPADYNPYQRLLSDNIGNDFDVIFQPNNKFIFITYPYFLLKASLKNTEIVHIHWLYFLKFPFFINEKVTLRASYLNTRLFLFLIKLLRLKVVWTVHNVLPHKQLTSDDRKIRQILANMSNAKIIHANATRIAMKNLGLNTDNLFLIPHGNFKSVYPATVSRQHARKYLDIPSGAVILLFFGRMEPYKNVPDLIEAFRKLKMSHDNLHLVLAGRLVEPKLVNLLEAVRKDLKDLHIYDQYVKDESVQYFFKAADLAVFPYSDITTSGSVLLASTFGVPVIAPRLGGLAELPQDIGQFYAPNTARMLIKSIEKCLADSKKESLQMSRRSRAYSDSLDWSVIGRKSKEVYRHVLDK